MSLRALLFVALLALAPTASAQNEVTTNHACTSAEWRQLSRAIQRFCRGHAAACEDSDNLVMCNPELHGVAITRREPFLLVLQPDCWRWEVTLAPPRGTTDRSAFLRDPLPVLLRSGWRVADVMLDVGRCD